MQIIVLDIDLNGALDLCAKDLLITIRVKITMSARLNVVVGPASTLLRWEQHPCMMYTHIYLFH